MLYFLIYEGLGTTIARTKKNGHCWIQKKPNNKVTILSLSPHFGKTKLEDMYSHFTLRSIKQRFNAFIQKQG